MKSMPSYEFRREVKKEAIIDSQQFSLTTERTPLWDRINPDLEPNQSSKQHRRKRRRWKMYLFFIVALAISLILCRKKNKPSISKPRRFVPALVQVPRGLPGFPSFWDFHTVDHSPIHVSYDKRALKLNGTRAMFISGSVHPVRATRATFEQVLDEAVLNGLNMITLYIMWGYHQPFPNKPMNWSLPGGDWELADALRMAGSRGLFVHVRPGPFACAEYNYGGIPEWVPLTTPAMRMRRFNQPWMDRMQEYIQSVVGYLTRHELWAHQGGPIVLAQIENELGEENETETSAAENFMAVINDSVSSDLNGEEPILDGSNVTGTAAPASVQAYADWCGELVRDLLPEVVWTMCNGLFANNTISTFNGVNGVDWLERHGDSNRTQVDQPAMWIEHEGGFQVWGDSPSYPSDYFWGRTARDMAHNSLQWLARGGTILNYYMFWGGYNRGRSAAAGIMNAYVMDGVLCPSGERRHPKFDHFQALHHAIVSAAPTLLYCESAVLQNVSVEVLENHTWINSTHQTLFTYRGESQTIAFIENEEPVMKSIRAIVRNANVKEVFDVRPYSSILLIDGVVVFDSGEVTSQSQRFKRAKSYRKLFHRTEQIEPVKMSRSEGLITETKPVEQTKLLRDSVVSSDYAWYETNLAVMIAHSDVKIVIETQRANSMSVFVDGIFRGEGNTHSHSEGPVSLTIDIGTIEPGSYTLTMLSESLGYNNLIGRWGAPTSAKSKGITGDVIFVSESTGYNTSLVDGTREWRSLAGLSKERSGHHFVFHNSTFEKPSSNRKLVSIDGEAEGRPVWIMALFETPAEYNPSRGEKLFLEITQGRGHIWLNGHDLGRYWNITQAPSSPNTYSQQYYHLPDDWLIGRSGSSSTQEAVNEVTLFSIFGDTHENIRLVISGLEHHNSWSIPDVVGYPDACI